MDNSESSELKREVLLKVLTGDEVSRTVLHTLCNLGLIRRRGSVKKKVDTKAWYGLPVTDFELTAKGLRRLQGD